MSAARHSGFVTPLLEPTAKAGDRKRLPKAGDEKRFGADNRRPGDSVGQVGVKRYVNLNWCSVLVLSLGELHPVDNLLRAAGRFSIRGPVGGITAATTGIATGSPVVPAIGAAVGEAGRRLATAATKRNFSRADAMVRNRGQAPFSPIAAENAELIANRLLETGGRAATPILLDRLQR